MGKKFYISDLHLGHKKCIDFDNRPFFTLKEMHETIIHNWNRVVTKDDLVYILGDMYWDNSYVNVVLCHYPIAHWINADYGYIHLYGHIHNARDNRPFEEYKKTMQTKGCPYLCYNVGCMLHNYTPVTLEQLRKENKK